MSDEVTFASKLMELLGGKYSPAMRRSVQTVVLYEANRCLKDRYSSLRPFQRKIALYDTASDIINTLGFIPPYHRIEIMFRTASGKVPLSPDLAWRRMKLIDREIQKTIIPKIRPFLDADKSHKECCDDFIQSQYETVSGVKGKKHPVVWEYSHLNIFLAYRMFYSGEDVDPDLPPARDPNPNRVVPNKKPAVYPPDPTMGSGRGGSDYDSDGSHHLRSYADEITGGGSGKKRGRKGKRGELDADGRRAMLKEVRDHLEILREFEGVIPADELNKRKRELFMSLPPAPTGKGKKKGAAAAAAAAAALGDQALGTDGGAEAGAEGEDPEEPAAKKIKTDEEMAAEIDAELQQNEAV